MDTPMLPGLPDIQRTPDTRNVFIPEVGVRGVKLPIRVLRKTPKTEELLRKGVGASSYDVVDTVGDFEMTVSLPAEVKGTHMSRFTEVLMSHLNGVGIFSSSHLKDVVVEIASKLHAADARVKVELDYFVPQNSPATDKPGVAPLKGMLEVSIKSGRLKCITGIELNGKTCCPCSREISDFDHTTGKGRGAHAQRSNIKLRVGHPSTRLIWFEDLVELAWAAYSSPIYPVLKRADERHVTMGAYDNPKFVEDVIRDLSVRCRTLPGIDWFDATVVNSESIHYHDAIASVTQVVPYIP